MKLINKQMTQVLFFLFVGGTTFLIDLLVTLILNKICMLPPFLASPIGFLSGFFFNFPMNKNKVFKHGADDRFSLRSQIILYAGLSIANLCITSAFTQILTVNIGIEIAATKVIITGCMAVWNFFIFKLFIFSKANDAVEKPE